MKKQLVTFNNPPLIEMVLSLQFVPIERFSNAHGGWFWKNYLSNKWGNVQQANLIADHFEGFGESKKWGKMGPKLKLIEDSEASRLQISNDSGNRMLQIQPSRFVYNWRRRDSDYPRFEIVAKEYNEYFAKFKQFVNDAELGDVALNQWEITYVNHIHKDKVWTSLSELSQLFPGFYTPAQDNLAPDNFDCKWSLIIGDNQGRLHIDAKYVKIASETGPEAIFLQFIARGPLDASEEYKSGFDLGHKTIVNTFANITSEEAHAIWDRTD